MGAPFSLRPENQLHGHATGHVDGQRDSIIADERSSGAGDGLLRKTNRGKKGESQGELNQLLEELVLLGVAV